MMTDGHWPQEVRKIGFRSWKVILILMISRESSICSNVDVSNRKDYSGYFYNSNNSTG